MAAHQSDAPARAPIINPSVHAMTDPLKNAQFREASRQRLACLDSGVCSKDSAAMQAFERLLGKVPEHTAGVAHIWFLPDNENYTNAQFDRARARQPLGFVADNRKHADYNTSVNSWLEQREFVNQAPSLLQHEYPELAANITTALAALKAIEPPDPVGLIPVEPPHSSFSCGAGIEMQVGPGGGLVSCL
jgi:hypothetical protein